ncbi:hypothetical protein EDO6_05005 [Paenibacillus xylanexedens]|nr:hypothetical protein EDO6_05005 [Paenibacillus xylanexedens]
MIAHSSALVECYVITIQSGGECFGTGLAASFAIRFQV